MILVSCKYNIKLFARLMHDGFESFQFLELPCIVDDILVKSEEEITGNRLNLNKLVGDWEKRLFFTFKGLSSY